MWVESLDTRRHDRAGFECGKPELNQWLRESAGQAEKRGSARTFVLTDDGVRIIGYYSIASHSVSVESAPPTVSKGHPSRLHLPAVLLAQLAIRADWQRQGLGERLLSDATRRVVELSEVLGVVVMVVDALDEEAAQYYERYGFIRWPAGKLRLFATLRDLRSTFLS